MEQSFVFVCNDVTRSIAENFQHLFNDLRLKSVIIHELNDNCVQDNDRIYIIIHTNKFIVPKKCIFYQIEQRASKWFNSNYVHLMKESKCIWEYSICNRIAYDSIKLPNIFHVPMPYFKYKHEVCAEIKYDLLFFGALNDRREKILSILKQRYNINVACGIVGVQMDDLIKQSKIIINLHFYKAPVLETARFNQVLQYNKLIITEKSSKDDQYNMELYKDIVIFVDQIQNNNVTELCTAIDYWLNDEVYNKKIQENKSKLNDLQNKSIFHVHKALLGIDLMSNNMKFDLKPNIPYCLHLFETPHRMTAFKLQRNMTALPNYEIYPAVRHTIPWIGCGLSYQNIMYNAKRCNLSKIMVFEDDCLFPVDFKNKCEIINEFLERYHKWDIFVGCSADLSVDSIVNFAVYKGIIFVELSDTASCVANIYKSSAYDTFINWNAANHIDRHTENHRLTFITTVLEKLIFLDNHQAYINFSL